MATAKLINLDVDQIFEQNHISEIEVVNRKIQAEIENKREELRTMVNLICFLIMPIITTITIPFRIDFRLASDTET